VLLGSNFLVPGSTLIVELVAFLGVLWVLARYVYPRLRAAMEQRQSVIRQSLDDAETARQRAQEADAEYRRTMERARQESRAMVDEANRQAQRAREDVRQQAEQESRRIVAQAQTQIEASARQATEELRQHVSETVIAVVEKVVGEAMDARSQRELIDRTIAEVEGEATGATPASR
jgi:F-type H+-transporting ATPase subunit b